MSKHDASTERPKRRSRRDRTEEILEATTNFFSEYGFRGTTLAMVADSVGLTEAGVLHYFPSKIHLLQGVLEYRDQKDFEKYKALIDVKKEGFGELFALLEAYYAEDKKFPELVQLFIVLVGESIRSEHPSHDFFVDRYQRIRGIFIEQFQMLSGPEIRSDVDLHHLATLVVAVLDGLRIQWLLEPEEIDFIGPFELFCEIVIGYIDRSADFKNAN